jgi:hypothetical protein
VEHRLEEGSGLRPWVRIARRAGRESRKPERGDAVNAPRPQSRLTVAALRAELPTIPPAERVPTLRYGDAEFAVGRYNLETSSVHEGAFLFTERATGGGSADGGQSPATIRQTGILGGGGGGKPPSPIVMDGIVPSNVATVTLQFPSSTTCS